MPLTQQDFKDATLTGLREILSDDNTEIKEGGDYRYKSTLYVYSNGVLVFNIDRQTMTFMFGGGRAPDKYTLYINSEEVDLGYGVAEKLYKEVEQEKTNRELAAYQLQKDTKKAEYQGEILSFLAQFEPIEPIAGLPMSEWAFRDLVVGYVKKIMKNPNNKMEEHGAKYRSEESVHSKIGTPIFYVERHAMRSLVGDRPAPDRYTLYINGKEFELQHGVAEKLYNDMWHERVARKNAAREAAEDAKTEQQQNSVLDFLGRFSQSRQ